MTAGRPGARRQGGRRPPPHGGARRAARDVDPLARPLLRDLPPRPPLVHGQGAPRDRRLAAAAGVAVPRRRRRLAAGGRRGRGRGDDESYCSPVL